MGMRAFFTESGERSKQVSLPERVFFFGAARHSIASVLVCLVHSIR
jgi:hypothetical protein